MGRNDWQIKSLGEVAEFITTGKTPSTKVSDYFGGQILWFTPSDIGISKYLILSERTLTQKAVLEGKAVLFPKGTLLITCIGNIGRVGILRHDGSSNQQITGIKFKSNIDVDYAYYWFRKNSHHLIYKANKAIVPILNNSQLREIKIEHPPLPIQKQIAEILEKADQAKQKRKEVNKLAEQFLQSAFIEMFGDPVKNPKGWKTKSISNIVKIPLQNGVYYPKELYVNSQDETGTKMIHMADAFYGDVETRFLRRVLIKQSEIDKYKIQSGDILIARRSLNYEGSAKASLIKNVGENLIYESSLIRLRTDNGIIHPIYLYHFLSNEQARKKYVLKYVTSSTISGINQTNLGSVEILIPPLSLQQQFAELVLKTDALKEKQKESEKELENLFSSLMQKAFKGELVS